MYLYKSRSIKNAFLIAGIFSVSTLSFSAGQSSANYRIDWDTMAGGHGDMSSANHKLSGTIGQSSAIGESTSSNYLLYAGYQVLMDQDGDGWRDIGDNCIDAKNENQYDSDGDNFGNWCDADFNGDLLTNSEDLTYFKAQFFTSDPDADLNGDGIVNSIDLTRFKQLFFKPPGPSGLVP